MSNEKPRGRRKTHRYDLVLQESLFQDDALPNPFRKPVEVLHSIAKAEMTLIQRKTMNAWLKNAVDEPADKQGWYSMTVTQFAEAIGYESRNLQHIKDSIRELMGVVFEWDVLPKVGERNGVSIHRGDWTASVLFTDVKYVNGTLKYRINDTLKDKILRPEVYALIDLNEGKKFSTASAHALYEHCMRFVNVGRTTAVDWRLLKDMIVGGEADTYNIFKYFNAKVLKPSIAEVNRDSDIQIQELRTFVGKSVNTIQFQVSKKTQETVWQPDSVDEMVLVGQVIAIGVPASEARKIVRQFSHESIAQALRFTSERMADTRTGEGLDNPGAYFRSALKNGYGLDKASAAKKAPAQKAPTASNMSGLSALEQAFQIERMKEAENYFAELSADARLELVGRYNDQQPTRGLRVTQGKPKNATRAAFLTWLAVDTWGVATDADLLDFAKKRG